MQLILILISLIFCSCDEAAQRFCGESAFQKQVEEKIGSLYKNYGSVEFIPCEFYSVRFNVKVENIDTTVLEDVHRILFNEKTNEGWRSMDVYAGDKYLFTHRHNGNPYQMTGD